ncbi:flagellar protein FlgN [Peptococcaceae bacterium]|nr:flagellar protein FlgN [Peptococcaceae bacterium]MCL0077558.1 flagellar protein FlgN [Peptococcaceae bacterium]MCL0106785.1 flagellar protein FlgN [Peptococcaceae bacterium]
MSVKLFENLMKILKEQYDILGEILAVLHEQNEALRKTDINMINSTLQRLTALSKEMQYLDARREDIQLEIAKACKSDKKDVTVSELITNSVPDEIIKKELQEIKLKFDERFKEVKEINETNAVLIKQALSVVNTVLNIIKSGTSLTYEPKSNKEQSGFSVLNKTV